VKWLRESLRTSNAKTNIVITHHAPSALSIPGHLKHDMVSAAYASKLEDLIEETGPDIWVHGHIHQPFDYFVGRTRIICNPRGYLHQPYNGYNKKLVLEVNG
jgi:Icc-related predicted phosphoesterase